MQRVVGPSGQSETSLDHLKPSPVTLRVQAMVLAAIAAVMLTVGYVIINSAVGTVPSYTAGIFMYTLGMGTWIACLVFLVRSYLPFKDSNNS